jgi:phosphate transport system substrate-binding protein
MKLMILAAILCSLFHSAEAARLRGKVMIDGSSTVFPITEAIAEDFRQPQPRVRVAIGVSGTGGGFKKFVKGEIDINNASRKIKDSEVQLAKKNNVEYKEFPVAYDGISIVINKDNDWLDYLTVAELRKIWQPKSKVKTWKDIRPSWPDKPLRLYGPGTDSGTFDYFTKAINGKSHVSRSDYTKSEDDNVLVQGVMNDKFAMAYFGFAYYKENTSKIKAVPIKNTTTSAAVYPTEKTINNGSYKPLAREVYVYINPESLKRESVFEFMKHYFSNANRLVNDVGYVALKQESYNASIRELESLRQKVKNDKLSSKN